MVKIKTKDVKKSDTFQERIQGVLHFISENRKRLYLGAGVIAALILIILGWYFYRADYEKNAQKLYAIAFSTYQFSPGAGGESYMRAIGLYREVVEKYPGSRAAANALFSLGNLYYRLNDIDRSIKAYEEFLKETGGRNDLRSLAYNGLGYCYESKGDLQKAREAYGNSLKDTIGGAFSGVTYMNMARISVELKDEKSAREYYQKALEQKNEPLIEAMIKRKMADLDS